jgi:hypothetical protein
MATKKKIKISLKKPKILLSSNQKLEVEEAYEYFNEYYHPETGIVPLNQQVTMEHFMEFYFVVKNLFNKKFPKEEFFFESDERCEVLNELLEKYSNYNLI